MKLNLFRFIVLESEKALSRPPHTKRVQHIFEHVEPGILFYPIGEPVPVIVRGKGCVGMGTILELTIRYQPEESGRSSSFTKKADTCIRVSFSSSEDKDLMKAYYTLYRGSIQTASSEDPFEDAQDQILPGVEGLRTGPIEMKRPSPIRPAIHPGSSSWWDDDDDDDDEF